MDSNHDKQIQRLLCYRYTIRQDWLAGKYQNRLWSQATIIKFDARRISTHIEKSG